MGAGKSSIVNVLHGLLDLDDGDENAVAKTSSGVESCTCIVKPYSCSHDGISLRVIDTPGFEEDNDKNNEISSQILSKVPEFLKDGFDAFFLVVSIERKSDFKLSNIMSSWNSLINEEGYKHGFVVFTFADNIIYDETAENEKIQEFKKVMANIAPSGLLDSVKYLFYRHNKLTLFRNNKKEKIYDEGARRVFLENAYAGIYQKCIENNGRSFSTLEMMQAKQNHEAELTMIEEYRKKRLEMKRLYENLVATTGTLSADLIKISEAAKKVAPSTFEIVNETKKTQKQILQDETNFHAQHSNFYEGVTKFHFDREQIEQAAKNLTAFVEVCHESLETYNIVTKKFTETFNTMQPLKIETSSLPWPPFYFLSDWLTRADLLPYLQRELNEAFKYYKDKFEVVADDIKNGNVAMPKLNVTNPTLSNYTSHMEKLKTFNSTISLAAERIRNSTIEMEKIPSISDYPNNQIMLQIANYDRHREFVWGVSPRTYFRFKQDVEELPIYYVNFNETVREGADSMFRRQLREFFGYRVK
ncbi:hypothetical protein O9G_003362 [Rozella allomycis CSF55]|uniref:AIG1-type G domain-containing protein n=1 Tax=Rozella allomycis (strain CSF55) TaxID=988480 RepID=A0A075B404_ROZAC|nr:hypothetical protein O9G_003362 [Rozella allomycis CSF55]|eukprot:EPZ35744.1 hypothetical protein O9G_003362 [Rozella allomycis CSF55]